jgi:hypothetical protein
VAPFIYQASGLVIASPLFCPELAPADAAPYITFRLGSVPDDLPLPRTEGVVFQARPGQFLLKIDDVARYLVEGGQSVTIDPAPGASEAAVRLFLLNTVLAVLLLQRGGLLPLHASSLRTERGAVLFAGHSGAGKSTLAAEFLRRGWTLLSDDLAPLELPHGNGQAAVMVWPVFPQLKLWADAARHLGYVLEGLVRVRPEEEKYSVPAAGGFSPAPVPLRAAYVLTTHSRPEVTLQALSPAERFKVLTRRTAGMPFVEGLGLRAAHFQMISALAPRLPLTRVLRPDGGLSVTAVADAVEAHLATPAAAAA